MEYVSGYLKAVNTGKKQAISTIASDQTIKYRMKEITSFLRNGVTEMGGKNKVNPI